jgi:hypothetical protein
MINNRSTSQQVRILVFKNFKLFGRSTASIFTMIFIPLLIASSLFFFNWLIQNAKLECIELDTEEYQNQNLPKCVNPTDCKSIVYFVLEPMLDGQNERILQSGSSIIADSGSEVEDKKANNFSKKTFESFYDLISKSANNTTRMTVSKPEKQAEDGLEEKATPLEESFKPKKLERIRKIMSILADNNSLDLNEDIKEVKVHSSREISEYTNSHRNQTQISYIFCNSEWDISFNQMDLAIPCSFENLTDQDMLFYSVHYNVTHGVENPFMFKLSSAYPLNHLLVSAKKELDKAIIQHTTNSTNFEFEFSTKGFPTTTCMRFEGYDFISSFGSFFLYLPSAVILIFFLIFSSDFFS